MGVIWPCLFPFNVFSLKIYVQLHSGNFFSRKSVLKNRMLIGCELKLHHGKLFSDSKSRKQISWSWYSENMIRKVEIRFEIASWEIIFWFQEVENRFREVDILRTWFEKSKYCLAVKVHWSFILIRSTFQGVQQKEVVGVWNIIEKVHFGKETLAQFNETFSRQKVIKFSPGD